MLAVSSRIILLELRKSLLERGHTIKSFAEANGWSPNTVQRILYRHYASETPPRTLLAHNVLSKIREVINGSQA
jgi:lambda repressor-like predicted transcriptional regulator